MAELVIEPYNGALALIVRCEGNGVAGMRVEHDQSRWPEKVQVHRCRHCGHRHRFSKRSAAVAQ